MFIKKIAYLTLFIFVSINIVHAKIDPSVEIKFTIDDKTTTLTLGDIQKSVPAYKISLFNPVYKRTMTYRAFKFAQVAKLANMDIFDAQEVTFLATDGYNAVLDHSLLEKYPAPWLAFEEVNAEGGRTFSLKHKGDETSDPGPFYLMWQEVKTYKSFPWPNAVNHVVINNKYDPYFEITPAAQSSKSIKNGFQVFKSTCITCHSINLVGGTIGPELNLPKNITEYRSKDFLKAWINDPSSFRARSKMKGFGKVSADEIDDVIAYLEYMKTRKSIEKLANL